jgi:hypothetical protein
LIMQKSNLLRDFKRESKESLRENCVELMHSLLLFNTALPPLFIYCDNFRFPVFDSKLNPF